jgi:ribonucleoside-diphosphate reductase alpha subunit
MYMQVLKRNSTYEDVSFDKVLKRLKVLSEPDLINVNVYELTQNVCSRIYNGVKTSELDELAATMCSSMIVDHPDYGVLAARIATSNHHKNTSPSFSETVTTLYENGVINDDIYRITIQNKEKLNSYIDYSKDYDYDYFAFMTLEKMYLLRVNNKPIERIQHMFMRVALGIHLDDIKEALQTYDCMSSKYFVHATPTLFNAGTKMQQLSSCFLVHMEDDSIDGIFNTLKDCALISKYAGGIGLNVHNVRSKNSYIAGTNGISSGIIPMLRVFNNTARYVNQAGRRNGSIAVFLEPWHADIEDFLQLRKNHGSEDERARDLFYSMWIPDLFMERVKADGKWSLMCPNVSKGLSEVYGDEFVELYEKYESEGRYVRQVNAQDIWFKILEAQIETGVPYIGFKDHVNKKTNQSNIGIIKSSNLCMEICEVSAPDEIAVCNLASICLKTYVDVDKKEFNFEKLYEMTKIIVKNLNKIIDVNFYPVDKAERSNKRHRPIGVGVQGLADTFILMRIPFDSEEALELDKRIFETMYYAAMEASCELAIKYGPYETFQGSPVSQGIFQFDMWGVTPTEAYDWVRLKEMVKEHGVRNSLLISPMPTASTSQIMGSNECFEPFTSNLYKRKTLAGEFIIVNKYLMSDLIKEGLWNTDIKNKIMLNEGSIQRIESIPQDLKDLYKTVWEIKQKNIIDHAAIRAPYICQSQSMNLFMESPDFRKLSSMHFYSWSQGLKTGIYYLRSKAKAKTQQFTLDPKLTLLANTRDDSNDVCVSCSA